MVQATRYSPNMTVTFATENGNIVVRGIENKAIPPGTTIDNSVIEVDTNNDLSQDAGQFTITLAYNKMWEQILASNDKVTIEMKRDNNDIDPMVFIGLIDSVTRGVTIANNQAQRIVNVAGRTFAKTLINFEIGVVENDIVDQTTGWLMAALGGNTSFMGQSAADIIKNVMTGLVFKYMSYTFSDGSKIADSLNLKLSSRSDETLFDDSSFINFQGSVLAFIQEILNDPFNQMFFETYNGKATMVVRETPFNPDNWYGLPLHIVSDEEVLVENLGRNDMETYTLFSVQMQTYFSATDPQNTLQVFPFWYKPNFDKYGLRRLQRYTYYVGYASQQDTNNSSQVQAYQTDLFNWFIMNPDFWSGHLTVMGRPTYKVGDRLLYRSKDNNETYEFFIESVAHQFINFGYWTTTLGVTRGLINSGDARFQPPWGMGTVYPGNSWGVNTAAADAGYSASGTYINPGDTPTGSAAGVVTSAKSYVGKITYLFGRGRNMSDAQQNIFDCSSFVWWVYHQNGINLGDQSSVTTYSLAKQGTAETLGSIQPGDLIMFNTDGRNGHVGIYIGNGQFVSAENEQAGCRVGDVNTWVNLYGLGDIRRILS